jgi:hypothetical protein
MKKSVFKGTWCGRKGTSTSYLMTKSAIGKRVVVHVWDDTPKVAEVTAMSGSFWRGPAGKIFEKFSLVGYSEEAILKEVYGLASKHFYGRS